MKLKFTAFLLLYSVWIVPLSIARAQGTAFTYQGRLNDGGNPANGTYDFRFRLATDPLANNYIGSPYQTNGIAVAGGLFTAAPDFGPGIFTGSNYWLEVDVRTNGAVGYAALAPLQKLTPAPYAVFATSSSNLLGTLPASQLSGSILNGNLPASPSFSGVNVSNVNALTLNGLSSAGFWQLGGNNVSPGQFLGSTNNQPVEIWAGGQRAMRFEPTAGGAPNIIAGFPNNSVSGGAFGSAIGGGFQNASQSSQTFIGAGSFNTILSNSPSSTIVGGVNNIIFTNAYDSFIGGGQQNLIVGYSSPIGYFHSSIVGGQGNYINGSFWSLIGGGYYSKIEYATDSLIGGGYMNGIELANYSVVGGGLQNTMYSSTAATIGGGSQNFINYYCDYSVIAGGVSNQIFYSTVNGTIGGGYSNFVNGISSTVAGGEQNSAIAFRDTVGGGFQNTASGGISTVSGGWTNAASGNSSTVGGGDHNVASGLTATVPGGANNLASGFGSFAAGRNAEALHAGSFVWSDSQNASFFSTAQDEFSVRAFNGVHIQTDKGVHLDAGDRPIIVRDWDVFAANAPSYKAGIGRWGLFMEPSLLTIGIPDIVGRGFQVAKYSTNGLYTTLVSVDQSGNFFAANNVYAHGVLLTSDRDAKEHFVELDAKGVLAKVVALPITEWNYKSDTAGDKHIGPVAQDFHKAFGLNGADDKHISAVDEGGVALSAIQGLNQRVDALTAENAELKNRLATLEELIRDYKNSK